MFKLMGKSYENFKFLGVSIKKMYNSILYGYSKTNTN